jgi:hypothetical protein
LKWLSNFKNAFSTGNPLQRPLSGGLDPKKCIQEAACDPVNNTEILRKESVSIFKISTFTNFKEANRKVII